MGKAARHFVIIGDVGGAATYHVGDEAMLDANLTAIRAREGNVTFSIISGDPDWSASEYRAEAIQPLGFDLRDLSDDDRLKRLHDLERIATRWRATAELPQDGWGAEVIRHLAKADGLILSGGGNLCSTWPQHIWERVALLRLAERLGKPAFMLGQTLGPDLSSFEKTLLSQSLSKAALVGVREYTSAAVALALGIPPKKIHYQTDDAVFLPEEPIPEENLNPDLRPGGAPWMAVTIAPFADPNVADSRIPLFAQELSKISRATGLRLVFIPHVRAVRGDLAGSDCLIAQAVADRLEVEISPIVLDVLRARQVKWLTRQSSFVLSSRYHPVVFALAGGVPAFGIFCDAYTRAKIEGALAHAALQECSLDLDSFLHGQLSDKVMAVWQRRAEIRTQLQSLVPVWKRQKDNLYERLLGALEAPLPSGKPRRPAAPRVVEPLHELLAVQHEALRACERRAEAKAKERDLLSEYWQTRMAALEQSRREEGRRERGLVVQLQAKLASLAQLLQEKETTIDSLQSRLAAAHVEMEALQRSLHEKDALQELDQARIALLEQSTERHRWLLGLSETASAARTMSGAVLRSAWSRWGRGTQRKD